MAAADPKAVDLSMDVHDRVERLLADFDRDWADGRFATTVEQLPPVGHPLRASALNGLFRVEIVRQARNGGPGLETYLARWPELGTRDSVPVSLILLEYRARTKAGTNPRLEEYAGRFPRQADELRRLLAGDAPAPAADAARVPDPPSPAPASSRVPSPSFLSPSSPGSSTSLHDDNGTAGPALPEQFGRYRILKKLGQGGMGAVYLAHDSKLDRRVALKVPTFSPGSDPDNLERFYREARATATIHHPNLCPLYDVGEFNGIPYLTMAYIEGWPLAHFVRPDKRLPQAGTAALVRTVALAIAEAHKHGIIHRDLKPGNIHVDKRGQPIVMDFGLARWLKADKDDVRLTKSGSILGAPVYMSPEQVYGDVENMGAACDVYSLGVILYELLTARLPFEGGTTAVLAKTLIQAPTPPSKHRPDLDPRLEAICLKAMSKPIHQRYGSMAEMAAALADYIRADKLERDGGSSDSHSSVLGQSHAGTARAPMSDSSGNFPSGPRSSSTGLESSRPTPPPSGRETITGPPDLDIMAPSPKGRIPTTGDDAGPLADPSNTFIRRVSPKPPPKLKQIRQSSRKWWLIGGGAALLLAVGGLLTWLLWPGPPVSTIRIVLNPSDAQVSVEIDDRVVDPQLLVNPVELKPGGHRLVVAGNGFEPYRDEFTVGKGDNPPLSVELTAKPVAKMAKDLGLPPGPAPARLEEPFVGHGRPVLCVAVNGDGTKAISGGEDGRLIVWDMVTHKLGTPVNAHKGPVYAVAVSADGSRAASSGADGTVKVWNFVSPTSIIPSAAWQHKAAVLAVALSADGKLLLFGGEDRTVVLWEIEKGNAAGATKPFAGHTGAVRCVALSADGKKMASAGDDRTVRVWNPQQPAKEIKALAGHASTVRSIAFAADGNRLLSGGDDRTVRLWDVAKGAEIRRFPGHSGAVRGVSFAGGDKAVVSASVGPFDNAVHIWNADTGGAHRVVGRQKDGVNAVACARALFSQAISAGEDGTLRLWNLSKSSGDSPMPTPDTLVEVRRCRTPDGPNTGMDRVAVSRDGRRVLTAGMDGVGRLWDAATGAEIRALKHSAEPLHFVDFSADGKRVLTCGSDKKVRVWNADSGALLRTFEEHKERVWCAVFTPDGKHVVSGGDGKLALLWNTDTGAVVQRFENHHQKPINWLALSPDGKRLLTTSWDDTACLWEVNPGGDLTAKWIKTIKAGQDGICTVAFLPGAKHVVTGGRDRSVRLWDLDDGKEVKRLDGHTGAVYAVAVSPGGRRLVSTGQDGTVLLWELPSGRQLARYTGHSGIVGGVVFTPDGTQTVSAGADQTLRFLDLPRTSYDPAPLADSLVGKPAFKAFAPPHGDAIESVVVTQDGKRGVSASWDKTVRVWDLTANGKLLATLADHTDKVHGVAVSRDGKRALSAGYDHRIVLWSLENFKQPLKPIKSLTGHTDKVQSVAYSPNGKFAVSGGSDNTVRIWDMDKDSGAELKVCKGHTAPVWAVTFLSDNKHVLSAGFDRTVRKWDLTGKEVAKWQAPAEIHALAVSPDGRRAVTGGRDSAVHLWDVSTGELLASFRGHTATIAGVAISADGRWVLSGSDDRTARLWDVETGREVARFTATSSSVLAVAFAPDGKTALLGGRDKVVRQWTLPDFTHVIANTPVRVLAAAPERLALSPDNRLALFALADGTVRVWDTTTAKDVRQLKGHTKPVRSAAFSPDGKRACTASEDGTVRVWSVETGDELQKINSSRPVRSAVFAPNGTQILTGGDDGLAYLWKAETGEPIKKFAGHAGGINGVAFTPDGKRVLTASQDNSVRLWDAAKGDLVRTFSGHTGPVNTVAVSPDGRFVLSGAQDKTCRLWLTESGDLLHTFANQAGPVSVVAFSPDGRLALSCAGDNQVRLWDVRYGKPFTTFPAGNQAGVTGAAFGADGRHLAATSKDNRFRWWNLPPR